LAKDNPAAYQSDLADTQQGLGILYDARGRTKEAEDAYREALAIRRRLAGTNPAAFQPFVAETLYNLGLFYIHTQRFTEAETADREALEIYRQLVQVNPVAHTRHLAQTLNDLAALHGEAGNLTLLKSRPKRQSPSIGKRWRKAGWTGDDLAKNLLLLAVTKILDRQPASTTCPLLREAGSVAYDEELKREAAAKASACTLGDGKAKISGVI